MIDAAGWLDWTQRVPGVPDKIYSAPNAGLGLCLHSIEGTVAAAYARFLNTTKMSDGNYSPYAAASVMFINPKVGALIQMYPVTASTWTSGNSKANCSLWPVESEGVAGEPLNLNQVAQMLRLAGEFEAAHPGEIMTRGNDANPRTIFEHREVYAWATPNAGPTACPSGRYAPFYAALEGETPEMTKDEILALVNERVDAALAYQFPLLLKAAAEGGFTDAAARAAIAEFKAWVKS